MRYALFLVPDGRRSALLSPPPPGVLISMPVTMHHGATQEMARAMGVAPDMEEAMTFHLEDKLSWLIPLPVPPKMTAQAFIEQKQGKVFQSAAFAEEQFFVPLAFPLPDGSGERERILEKYICPHMGSNTHHPSVVESLWCAIHALITSGGPPN